MEVEKVLSPDQIFEKVRGYNLVITADRGLAEALNKRVEEPVLGDFAVTPLQLVDDSKGNFRRDIFLEFAETSDMTWKQISYLMDTVLECWRFNGDLGNVKALTGFGEQIDPIIEFLQEKETPYSKLQEARYSFPEKVAVVDLYQFSELEKQFLPQDYDEFNSYKTGKATQLSGFNVFESTGGVVRVCRDIVRESRPEQVGIVVHPGSQYQPLIESIFESENVPYVTQRTYSESEDVRNFVNLLRAGLTMKNVRLKDVRSILHQLNIRVPDVSDSQRIQEIDELEDFRELLNVLEYLSFEEVLQNYRSFSGRTGKIRDFLEQLDLLDQEVSVQKVQRMEYYLKRFDPAESETRQGVKLFDPRETATVDRSTVIFLGMDADWSEQVKDRPWIDRENERDRRITDFRKLVQSGDEQSYLVQDKLMNEDIKPCFYLNSLLDEDFSSFRDLPHNRYRPGETMKAHGFEKEGYDTDVEKVDMISQSGLNRFTQSPRLYFIEELIRDETDLNLRKGSIFHDYAEFHANHPEFAEDIDIDEVVELMIQELRQYTDESDLDSIRTECRIGIRNIRRFFREIEIQKNKIDGYDETESRGTNIFCDHYGKTTESDFTEVWFEDEEMGCHGLIDLVCGENKIVDFKSGRQYSREKIVKRSKIDLYKDQDRPDFQALMYLAQHSKRVEDQELEFTFLNFLADVGGEVTGEAEFDDCVTTIKYYPESFEEKAASMDVFEHLIRDVSKSNDRRKTLEKLGFTKYQKFLQENQIPEIYRKKEMLETEFADEFISSAKTSVGDYKYVEKGCKSALKKLVEFRTQNFFQEDVKHFKEFLDQKLNELNECKRNGFPVKANPDDLRHRDMIVK